MGAISLKEVTRLLGENPEEQPQQHATQQHYCQFCSAVMTHGDYQFLCHTGVQSYLCAKCAALVYDTVHKHRRAVMDSELVHETAWNDYQRGVTAIPPPPFAEAPSTAFARVWDHVRRWWRKFLAA